MVDKPTAEQIAHDLQGTCDSLTAALARYDAEGLENDLTFCLALDALVFCCVRCDWWHEQSEMAEDVPGDEWICRECFDDD